MEARSRLVPAEPALESSPAEKFGFLLCRWTLDPAPAPHKASTPLVLISTEKRQGPTRIELGCCVRWATGLFECRYGDTSVIVQIRISSFWLVSPQSYSKPCFYFSSSVFRVISGQVQRETHFVFKQKSGKSPPAARTCLFGKKLQEQLKP